MNLVPQTLRRRLRACPACHQLLRLVRDRYRRLGVARDTQVVIEGYPRCANSFATVAFMSAQPEPVRAAHHLHSLAQIKLGVQRGIPTLVLIREPRAAALSLTIRKELPRVDWALEEYLDFYRGVMPLARGIVVADFREATADMGAVTRRLNERFGTHFAEFDHTEANVAEVYQQLEVIEQNDAGGGEVRETHVARPSAARDEAKRQLAAQFDQSPARELAAAAAEVYQTILQQHGLADAAPQE